MATTKEEVIRLIADLQEEELKLVADYLDIKNASGDVFRSVIVYLSSKEAAYLEEAGDFLHDLKQFITKLPAFNLIDFDTPVKSPVVEKEPVYRNSLSS